MGQLVELVRRKVGADLEVRGDEEALEVELASRVACARATWPAIRVDDAALIAAIAERWDAETPASPESLAAIQVDDLLLACGCAAGEPAALAAFEQHCGAAIERALAATGVAPADRADLGQVVRQRLLVAPPDGVPRIAGYAARGALVAWVRVVATREAARALPRARREVAADDEDLAGQLVADDDPELGYLKRLYRAELKQAFRVAVDGLAERDRLLLQQHLIDRLGIDQLSRLHGVHRATAARWVQAAREAVLASTQQAMRERLRVDDAELASVLRLIQSQLDVSLPRVLGGA